MERDQRGCLPESSWLEQPGDRLLVPFIERAESGRIDLGRESQAFVLAKLCLYYM